MASTIVATFSLSAVAPMDTFPQRTCTLANRSTRNSTRARLEVLDDAAHVVGHRSRAGVRHEPARSENAAQRSDDAHGVGHGHGSVEVQPSALDALGKLVGANLFGPGITRLLDTVARGERNHSDGPPGAVRQRQRAAHLLVLMRGIHPEPQVQLDGFVKLRARELRQQVDGRGKREVGVRIHHLRRLPISFAVARHA